MKVIRAIQIIVLMSLAVMLLSACGGSQAQEVYTIGVVVESEPLIVTYDGFKAGMEELGYVEGENITYVYNGLVGTDPENYDREIENMLAQDVDLLFTLGNSPTLQAKQATAGTDFPVVFAPVIDPVGAGIVESVTQPGGNLTGVRTGVHLAKSLEWLLTVAPASRVYVPYHPDDVVSVTSFTAVQEAALALGVEVVDSEAFSPEEVVATIASLPEDTVVFLVPIPSLEPGLDDYAEAALEHGVVIGAYHPFYMRKGVLVNYSTDIFAIGQQAARLVDQVLRGIPPADLPVEPGDGFLTINLETADAIGLEISDDLLASAAEIIRVEE